MTDAWTSTKNMVALKEHFSWHFHSDVVASKKAVGDFPKQTKYYVHTRTTYVGS